MVRPLIESAPRHVRQGLPWEMAIMRFVHAADLHLDSPLRGLERYEGAPVDRIRGATRRALSNLVDLCLDEAAALLLLAGDLYDGDWRDYSTGLFFSAQMSRLREAEIPVVLIRGNHDAESRITKHLKLPANVHELGTRRPETVRLEELGVAVHGQGFASRSVTDDLAGAYPDAIGGWLNIGLLHTSIDGREGHADYAPTSLGTLTSKGYDYWALGHVHEREVVSEDPWIVFPGNLQGRHARETGEKGATVVHVEDGVITRASHQPLDVVRWHRLVVDGTGAASGHDIVDLARMALEDAADQSDERMVAARLVVTGRSPAHGDLASDPEQWESAIRAAATDAGDVWIEKVVFDTRATIDVGELRKRDDAIGQLARTLEGLREDDRALEGLLEELGELRRKLPRQAREGDGAVHLDAPEDLREVLEDVEQMLLPRLLLGGESP